MLLTHFSRSTTAMLKRGEITPHLFSRPLSWITIFPLRWSSISSNSSMYPVWHAKRKNKEKTPPGRSMPAETLFSPRRENSPCFCITDKNLTTTFDEGRTSTWRLPFLSACRPAKVKRGPGEGGGREGNRKGRGKKNALSAGGKKTTATTTVTKKNSAPKSFSGTHH
ncbi:MAG: hypothetical protein BJ554DRAFT_7863, partial [Olpidium bornovanus]